MYRFYVAKCGCDSNSGTAEAPFLTIERAQEAVRGCIAAGLNAPVTVTVQEGEYRGNGMVFGPADSGTPDCPITWEAEGTVVINGGISMKAEDFSAINEEEKARLHGEAKNKVVKADLKKYGLTGKDWGEICAFGAYNTANKYDGAVTSPLACELFVNDVRMTTARYPDEGFLYTEGAVREGQGIEHSGERKISDAEWDALRNPLGDIRRIDADTCARARGWKTLKDVWTFGYPQWDWADQASPIVGFDWEKQEMETQHVSIFGIRDRAPYYIFNVFEELDAPGEWYLDREEGILYLYPPCDLTSAELNISIMTGNLLKVEGATDLTIKGFVFTATRGDAIDISGDRNVLDGCEIKNVAEWAVKVQGNDCCVKNCNIHHTGRGGVRITGGDRNTLTSSGNLVTNNHIHHIGEIFKTYQPGIDVSGVNCIVSHNCIHDSAHMAIGFGGNDHVIEYNEIYDVCQIADDSGAIYSGRNYTACGTVIRYNYFHDMCSKAEKVHIGIFAVYCDDDMSGVSVYGNVMHRCQCALLFHGGHDMVFRNNLIIDGRDRSQFCLRFHVYLYWKDLVDENGTHAKTMREVPWQSDIWREKYPHLAEYITWDPEGEQRFPHYCDISNNMIINHEQIDVHLFNCFEQRLKNKFENNIRIADRAFAGIPEGDTLDLSHNRFAEIIPGFEDIPLNQMGLLK